MSEAESRLKDRSDQYKPTGTQQNREKLQKQAADRVDLERQQKLEELRMKHSTPPRPTAAPIEIDGEKQPIPEFPTGSAGDDTMGTTARTMDEKLSFIMANMVLKQDLQTMQAEWMQQTTVAISKAVDPLKDELCNMNGRITSLEQTGPITTDNAQMQNLIGKINAQQATLNKLDPANKSLSIIGWSDSESTDSRLERINDFMETNFPNTKYVRVDTVMKGPHSDRKPTGITCIEFFNRDTAEKTLKEINAKKLSLASHGTTLRFTRKQTEAQGKRNFHVREAERLIKKHPECRGKPVEVDWGKGKNEPRTITVDGTVVFTQGAMDIIGKFVGPYSSIVLE